MHLIRASTVATRTKAFTLIEVLVASTILIIMVGVIAATYSSAARVSTHASGRIDAFQSAREAFTHITNTLSQANLNTYWDYDNPNAPTQYIRKSELHFKCAPGLLGTTSHALFFQAYNGATSTPARYGGLQSLLNGYGFFIDYVPNPVPAALQAAVPTEPRFRLMEWRQPSEALEVYSTDGDNWFRNARNEAVPVADNVIALVVQPKLSPNDLPPAGWVDSYTYDTRANGSIPNQQPPQQHQLPPLVEVVLVCIDEQSFVRGGTGIADTLTQALNGLFQNASQGGSAASLNADLATLGSRLDAAGVAYRVFSTTVALREAKWSK